MWKKVWKVTVEEVAALLKEHPENIRRWIREGKLSATKVGRRYDISEEEAKRLNENSEIDIFHQNKKRVLAELLLETENNIKTQYSILEKEFKDKIELNTIGTNLELLNIINSLANDVRFNINIKKRIKKESGEKQHGKEIN